MSQLVLREGFEGMKDEVTDSILLGGVTGNVNWSPIFQEKQAHIFPGLCGPTTG